MSDALARCKEHGESWSRDCAGCDYAQVKRHDHAERPSTLKARIAALTSELAEARAERDSLAETRAALTANLNALTVDVATMRAERDAARRALADAIYERDDALRKKRDAQAERDALKAGKWAGAWRTHSDPANTCILAWRDGMRLQGYAATITCGATDPSYIWWRTPTFRGVDGVLVDTLDAAKDAADAHLIAAGWWLEGGPHKAGDAK